jgi:hypothetical protein
MTAFGRIDAWSRNPAGTEVEFSVPGKVAFQVHQSDSQKGLAWFPGKAPENVTRTGRGGNQ